MSTQRTKVRTQTDTSAPAFTGAPFTVAKTTQILINRWAGKLNVIYTHKKEWNSSTCYDTDVLWKGRGELVSTGHGVSVWDDDTALETEGDDGGTTVGIHPMALNCTLESV